MKTIRIQGWSIFVLLVVISMILLHRDNVIDRNAREVAIQRRDDQFAELKRLILDPDYRMASKHQDDK